MYAFLLLVLFIGNSIALVEEIPLPNELKVCFESLSRKSDMTKVPATEIQWICMQKSIWRLVDHSIMNISDQDRKWIDTILQIPDFQSSIAATSSATGSGRKKRQAASTLRIRTEYRLMNDLERDQYHRTVNKLKGMPIGNVSRYEFIANIHRGDAIPVAHFNPNFLGWHRVYLLIYENALRQIDPTVTVPYFASDLDDPLDDPTESVIWSDIFVGNGNGVVNSGPYANWKTPSGPLVRNIGAMGQLFAQNRIARILNNTRIEDISEPNARYENCLERQQNLVNRWIGGGSGQMSDLNSASHDPMYFNHMAYVDYIWEQFRMIQHQHGVNPASDYPTIRGIPGMNEPMGFGNLQNIDGFSSFFTESVYTYEYLPDCSHANPDCGSVYLRCDTSLSTSRCVSLTRKDWNKHLRATGQLGTNSNVGHNSGGFMFGQNDLAVALNENNKCMLASRGIQNRYRSDDMTDIREWVYIPVEIVSRRPPEKTIYDSYPVFHGNVIYDGDVYSPDAYRVLRNTLHTVRLGKYDYCKDTVSNAGKIYIKSEGLNYYGTYQEYVIVDNRLALSSAMGYVAVRSPELGMTQTIISAFDSCGRMCSAFCKMSGRKEYQPCHGALQMTSGSPKMYSLNFGEAVEDTWEFYKNRYFPTAKDDSVFIKFFCNYNEYWPKNIEKQPSVMSSQTSQPQRSPSMKSASPQVQNTQQQNRTPQTQRNLNVMKNPSRKSSNISPSLRLNTGAKPQRVNNINLSNKSNQQQQPRINQMAMQPRVNQNIAGAASMTGNTVSQNNGPTGIRNPGCLLGHGCVVAGACRSCTNGEKFACLKSTTLFAHCQGNSLLIRRCLSNSRFDVASGNCRMK